jgi:hypothetical protein|tara:strand:- start:394 stop:789 length:396 start_codon:yes stop_codon:yes gene_type:complete
MLPFGSGPKYRAGGYTPQYQAPAAYYNPRPKKIKKPITNPFDIDQDGDVDFKDVKAAIKRRKVKECQDCGKPLKKKSKYGTGLCVECYRNPPEHKLCKATVASGSRCKRRISSDSKQGYCGIHMKKHEKTQ